MNGNEDNLVARMGRDCDENHAPFQKKPLYIWANSFGDKESQKEDNFKSFVTGNALNHALEYIGIIPESEQSSLHLSAIFEEESQQQTKSRFPNHYESETKNRIQNLNKMFNELKSYFEDHFSQLIAIKPPNSVHIVSACPTCSVNEMEKLLLMLLGAAIQGSQMQDCIKKIKRFQSDVQEALIENIKQMSDSPDVFHIKPWSEYDNLEADTKQKIYEKLINLVRRLVFERNQSVHTQLMSDYFAGYMYCGQRKMYEAKAQGSESDFDDVRLNAALRQLKEELCEKTELLQDCREELEVTKKCVQKLQDELSTTHQQLKSCKKERDELDALREGQEKAHRLETELEKMRKKLQLYEHCHERVEVLQEENRNLQSQNESLLEQNSFLTIEKESLKLIISKEQNSLSEMNYTFSEFDGSTPLPPVDYKKETLIESEGELLTDPPKSLAVDFEIQHCMETLGECSTHDAETLTVEEEFVQKVPQLQLSSKAKTKTVHEKVTKVRRKRPSVYNIKSARRVLFPMRVNQRRVQLIGDAGNDCKVENCEGSTGNVVTKAAKSGAGASGKRKCSGRSNLKFTTKRRQQGTLGSHTLDMDNDADEELSISPNGPPNLSDLEDCESPVSFTQQSNNSEDFFMCSNRGSNEITTSFTERTFTVNEDANQNVPSVLSSNHFINRLALPLTATEFITNAENGNNYIKSCEILETDFCKRPYMCGDCTHDRFPDACDPNVEMNANSVEHYCTHVNVNLNHILQVEGSQDHANLGIINSISKTMQTVNLHSPEVSSASEDDDSVWYEYGCV